MLMLAAALGLALAAPAQAQQATPQDIGLSAPVIALMPILAKNGDALKLDAKQKAGVKEWAETMGPKRMALEKETAAQRAQLRKMIVADAPKADREALARKIGESESTLIMMRSNCVDHMRKLLSAEQLAEAVKMAGGA
jgi:hypothetical protein